MAKTRMGSSETARQSFLPSSPQRVAFLLRLDRTPPVDAASTAKQAAAQEDLSSENARLQRELSQLKAQVRLLAARDAERDSRFSALEAAFNGFARVSGDAGLGAADISIGETKETSSNTASN